jgi:hypothetical protein
MRAAAETFLRNELFLLSNTATPNGDKEIPGTAFCLINLYTRGLRRE